MTCILWSWVVCLCMLLMLMITRMGLSSYNGWCIPHSLAETSNQRTFSSIVPDTLSWQTLDQLLGSLHTKLWADWTVLWLCWLQWCNCKLTVFNLRVRWHFTQYLLAPRTSSLLRSWRPWMGGRIVRTGSNVTGGPLESLRMKWSIPGHPFLKAQLLKQSTTSLTIR